MSVRFGLLKSNRNLYIYRALECKAKKNCKSCSDSLWLLLTSWLDVPVVCKSVGGVFVWGLR